MFHAAVTNGGDSRYHATTRDSRFVLDTQGNGANPIDALLASLAACVAHHIIHWLRDRAIANPGFKVSAIGELAEDRSHLAAISLIADLGAVAPAKRQYPEILEYVRRCPIVGTLSSACRIEFSLADPAPPREDIPSTHPDPIPGYAFGAATVARSPVAADELTRLMQTVSLTDEDFASLRRAGDLLAGQLDAVVDAWREVVAATPHLAQCYASPAGVPDDNYKARVRERFKQWILDVCRRPYDRAWLDYQEEIGRRHCILAKNVADQASAVAHIPLRYVIAFTAVINDRLRPFLAAGEADPGAVEAMYSAWCKAVLLHVTLWSRPYVAEAVW